MYRPTTSIITLLFAAAVLFGAASAQSPRNPVSPFVDGETLTYEAKLSKIIRGIDVGDVTFTVKRPNSASDWIIAGSAKSKGTLLKFIKFSFLFDAESTIDHKLFRAKRTKKHDVQKDRIRDSETIFDYEKNLVTYTEVNPKEPMNPPRKIASEIGDKTQDIVSGLYSLRLMPLEVGKKFDVEVSDSGFVYNIPVAVTARERQKTVFGNVYCFKVEPQVFGKDRLIEKEGSMIIWLTDDARRVPVRAQINSSLGKVEVKLKSAKGLSM